MKKQIKKFLSIIVVLTLTAVIALSAVACDLNSSSAGGGNSGSGSSGEIVNPDPKPEPTPTPDPDPTPDPKPSEPSEPSTPTAVKPEKFTVNFDNNTTTITIDASWTAQDDSTYTVKVEYNGTEQTYTANDASISLSLAQAPINEYDVSVSVKSNGNKDKYLESDYCEAVTISKLTASEYLALTTSYGFENRYCSTKEELAIQYAYIADFELYDNEYGIILEGKQQTIDNRDTGKPSCYVYYALPNRDDLLETTSYGFPFPGWGLYDVISQLIDSISNPTSLAKFDTTSWFRDDDEVWWVGIEPMPKGKDDVGTIQTNRDDFVGTENEVGVNLNGQPLHVSATGRKDDKLPIDDSTKPIVEGFTVSPTLYAAVISGYNVKPKPGSRADQIWQYSRKVLKEITDENMSEQEIAHAIYDWVIYRTNYNYPWANHAVRDTYTQYLDAILGGTEFNLAVCNGYARAYNFLCRMMGLDCVHIIGTVGGGGHAWNKVRIDGVWYCVDTTWGDQKYDIRKFDAKGYEIEGEGFKGEYITHKYFMVSEEQLGYERSDRKEEKGFYEIPRATTDYNWYENQTFVDKNGKTRSLKIEAGDTEHATAVGEYFVSLYDGYMETHGVTFADPLDKTKTIVGKYGVVFDVDAEDDEMSIVENVLKKRFEHLIHNTPIAYVDIWNQNCILYCQGMRERDQFI